MPVEASTSESFTVFVSDSEARLRRALVSLYGPEVGREAAADALAYGWEHWTKVRDMANPAGYLFRVGQSRAKRYRTADQAFPGEPANPNSESWAEPRLDGALAGLSSKQRTSVLLIHGFGFTYDEVSRLMGVTRSTVQRQVERGMAKLRTALEVRSVA